MTCSTSSRIQSINGWPRGVGRKRSDAWLAFVETKSVGVVLHSQTHRKAIQIYRKCDKILSQSHRSAITMHRKTSQRKVKERKINKKKIVLPLLLPLNLNHDSSSLLWRRWQLTFPRRTIPWTQNGSYRTTRATAGKSEEIL